MAARLGHVLGLTLLCAVACRGGDALSAGRGSNLADDAPAGPVQPSAPGMNARVEVLHRGGQTFVTFTEAPDAPGARYRLYRSLRPLGPGDLAALNDGTRVATLPAGSGRALTDRWVDREGRWATRYLERWVVDPAQGQLPAGTGLFVYTVHADDLGGAPEAAATWAVTVQLDGGAEALLAVAAPVTERVSPTQAVRAATGADGRGHVYVQYMDLRRWNPTFHAPRAGNGFLGLDRQSDAVRRSVAYAYTYVVSEPDPKNCEGAVPARLPVFFSLHGWAGGSYRDEPRATEYFCALQITPTDFGETWFFGFAAKHDYRNAGAPGEGDVIVNFTEQRLLRMLDDLKRDAKLGARIDPERVYVWGHSMGGSGALALATRYPDVFAAAYASQPMTDHARDPQWLKDVTPKWGTPAQRLPIRSERPDGSPSPLAKYDGTPVFEWQHHPDQIKKRIADEMAPFGVSHGRRDTVLAWGLQGQPAYADFDAGRRAWGGAITDAEHSWAAFAGLPPTLDTDRSLAPFQGFRVRRDETVPGLSASSGNGALPPPDAPAPLAAYNANIAWSASWDPWGGPPVDEPGRWCMALRTTDDRTVNVDVTPRRTRQFKPAPGTHLTARAAPVAGGAEKRTPVIVGSDGLLTVPAAVSPGGVRLCFGPG